MSNARPKIPTDLISTESSSETCISTDEYFARIYFDVLKDKCASCHQTGSIGAEKSDFDLRPSSEAGYLEANMEAVRALAKTVSGEKSILLQKPVGGLGHEEELQYLKLTGAFGDLDAGLLKLQESVLARKAGKGQQEYLIVKLNDVLVTGRLIEDSELKQHVLSIAAETEKILIGLLQPPKTDDVILT
jgi:hypothetical protein